MARQTGMSAFRRAVLSHADWSKFPVLSFMATNWLEDVECHSLLMVIQSHLSGGAPHSLKDCFKLQQSFIWSDSFAGDTYWRQIQNRLDSDPDYHGDVVKAAKAAAVMAGASSAPQPPSTPAKNAGAAPSPAKAPNPAKVKTYTLSDPLWARFPELHRMAEEWLSPFECEELLVVVQNGVNLPRMHLNDFYNLDLAFTWSESPQGDAFWRAIEARLMANSYLLKKVKAEAPAWAADIDDFMPAKKAPKEWVPDKADGDHVMNVTRDMF